MSENVWYPLSRPGFDKICIKSAEGIYLYDNRGKAYIDANSGLWNVSLGYGNEAVNERIREQLSCFCYINPCEFESEASTELAILIKSLLHEDIDKIMYTCTGSEAVELVIKLIRKYASMGPTPQRNGIAITKHSYHGSYYGSMSCSSYDGKERMGYGPLLDGIYELSLPFCSCCKGKEVSEACTQKMKDTLHEELEKFGEKLAGILLEPILGSAGVIPLPQWYTEEIFEYADQHNILVAFDEVATGFGRTGEMFRYEKLGVKPDLITMSKGINNGALPIGAVAVSKKITERFRQKDEFIFHLSTQNANALSCAAGIATIHELIRDSRKILTEIKDKSRYFEQLLREKVLDNFTQIFDFRNCGMMFAIDLQNQKKTERLPMQELLKLVELLKKNGVIMEWSYIENVTSCLVIFLPFVISEKEIQELVLRVEKSFRRILV